MSEILQQLEEEISRYYVDVDTMRSAFSTVIVGQAKIFNIIFNALLNDGHILLEGVPGIAKTLMASTFSKLLELDFKRIQFTPDLIPGDIVGTVIYDNATKKFINKQGPIFTNFLLSDEINRAPAKVQSALLEGMQERQVTIGETTYKLPNPFIVMATQNPIEQEGTYPLPEAELDRFMFKALVRYPTMREERQIMERYENTMDIPIKSIISYAKFKKLKKISKKIFIDEKLKEYILSLIENTRVETNNNKSFFPFIELGLSPRATLFLIRAAKANAFLEKRSFVIPEDIKAMCYPIFRHRIIVSFTGLAENINSETIIDQLLDNVMVP